MSRHCFLLAFPHLFAISLRQFSSKFSSYFRVIFSTNFPAIFSTNFPANFSTNFPAIFHQFSRYFFLLSRHFVSQVSRYFFKVTLSSRSWVHANSFWTAEWSPVLDPIQNSGTKKLSIYYTEKTSLKPLFAKESIKITLHISCWAFFPLVTRLT